MAAMATTLWAMASSITMAAMATTSWRAAPHPISSMADLDRLPVRLAAGGSSLGQLGGTTRRRPGRHCTRGRRTRIVKGGYGEARVQAHDHEAEPRTPS